MELDKIKQPTKMIKFIDRFKNMSQMSSSNDMSSLDSGFESILNVDDDDSTFNESPSKSPRLSFEQKSPLHSSPSTPLKQNQYSEQYFQTPSSIILTPIKKQQIADVNGIYLSCIKSPFRSPQNYFNTDHYVRDRDQHTANLLRSPAFTTPFDITPVKQKIKCKQFEDSSVLEYGEENKSGLITTRTEEEFLELLFKSRHLASNPECIIGRSMGLDKFDIISELNKRSMNNVLDVIMNNLNASDYKNMHDVSKSWREVIQQDTKHNRERIKYIRFRKKYFDSNRVRERERVGERDGWKYKCFYLFFKGKSNKSRLHSRTMESKFT